MLGWGGGGLLVLGCVRRAGRGAQRSTRARTLLTLHAHPLPPPRARTLCSPCTHTLSPPPRARSVKKSGASGDQLKEAQAINKSLSSLGNVISALATEQVCARVWGGWGVGG